jgi:hypothetical protein
VEILAAVLFNEGSGRDRGERSPVLLAVVGAVVGVYLAFCSLERKAAIGEEGKRFFNLDKN